MSATRASRWQRRRAARRDTVRRMLAIGALVGVIAGILAQVAVNGVDEDIRALVRMALLLPAGIFVAWWLLIPGMAVDADEIEPIADTRIDVDARVERIEAAFDETAVPRMGAHRVSPPDEATRDELRSSIRRPDVSEDPARYGTRRPSIPPDEHATNA